MDHQNQCTNILNLDTPLQVIVDSDFLRYMREENMTKTDICVALCCKKANVKFYATRCVAENCPSEGECIERLVGNSNYIVGTGNEALRQKLQKVPGVSLICSSGGAFIVEKSFNKRREKRNRNSSERKKIEKREVLEQVKQAVYAEGSMLSGILNAVDPLFKEERRSEPDVGVLSARIMEKQNAVDSFYKEEMISEQAVGVMLARRKGRRNPATSKVLMSSRIIKTEKVSVAYFRPWRMVMRLASCKRKNKRLSKTSSIQVDLKKKQQSASSVTDTEWKCVPNNLLVGDKGKQDVMDPLFKKERISEPDADLMAAKMKRKKNTAASKEPLS